MRVRIVEAGEQEGASGGGIEVAEMRVGTGHTGNLRAGPNGQHFSPADGDGLHDLWLVLGEPHPGVDDSVEKDKVGFSSGGRHGGPRVSCSRVAADGGLRKAK